MEQRSASMRNWLGVVSRRRSAAPSSGRVSGIGSEMVGLLIDRLLAPFGSRGLHLPVALAAHARVRSGISDMISGSESSRSATNR